MLTKQKKQEMYQHWYQTSMEMATDNGLSQEEARKRSEDYANWLLCHAEFCDRQSRPLTRAEVRQAKLDILQFMEKNLGWRFTHESFDSREKTRFLAAIPAQKVLGILEKMVKEGTLERRVAGTTLHWTPVKKESAAA